MPERKPVTSPGGTDIERRRLCTALTVALSIASILTVGNPGPVSACGFHKPEDFFFGALGLTYPQSLSVLGAVIDASDKGVLAKQPPPRARDLFAYHRTVKRLHTFSELLRPAGDGTALPSFSLVLIDSMLWTRFEPGENGIAVTVHDEQPPYGEPVVVTHGEVLTALANRTLRPHQAEALGLLKLYGAGDDQDKIRRSFMVETGAGGVGTEG